MLEAAQTWEQDGIAHGAVRDIIGAVDETFLERMMLVFQDLATGYLLLEKWQKIVPMPPGTRWWSAARGVGHGGLVHGQ